MSELEQGPKKAGCSMSEAWDTLNELLRELDLETGDDEDRTPAKLLSLLDKLCESGLVQAKSAEVAQFRSLLIAEKEAVNNPNPERNERDSVKSDLGASVIATYLLETIYRRLGGGLRVGHEMS